MLKTISSITNAIGALNYKGTWNAAANLPALVSGVGTKGDYYVVGTAGSTTLDGISNWGIGDWAAFNGTVWQRVEGGADLNGVNLSVSGTSTLSGLTASTALALNASKEVVSVTNTGTGNNVLATSPSIATPTLTGDVSLSTGNITQGTAGKGVNFTANANAPGMTSELLNWYEEGTWTATLTDGTNDATMNANIGKYTRIGRAVFVCGNVSTTSLGSVTGDISIKGLPFTIASFAGGSVTYAANLNIAAGSNVQLLANNSGTSFLLFNWDSASGTTWMQASEWTNTGNISFSAMYFA